MPFASLYGFVNNGYTNYVCMVVPTGTVLPEGRYIYYEIVQRTDKKQLKRLGYCVHNVCIIKST